MEELRAEYESRSNESNRYINTMRFIERLDKYYLDNDLNGVIKHLDFWENEAISMYDDLGLLIILNEKMSYYRCIDNKVLENETLKKVLGLLDASEKMDSITLLTITKNIIVSLKNSDDKNDAVKLINKVQEVYEKRDKSQSYEYASLLNDKASLYNSLEMYDEAEEYFLKAIEILEKDNGHEEELAFSYIGLAHTLWDKDENIPRIELSLDKAIANLKANEKTNNPYYTNILKRCIPSLYAFKRNEAAKHFEEVLNSKR